MNLRRILKAVPWMFRLPMDGSLSNALLLFALIWLPTMALRLWGNLVPHPHFNFTLVPPALGLITWRRQRHHKWHFFTTLPLRTSELIAAAMLADLGAVLLFMSPMPFATLEGYITGFLAFWTVLMMAGLTSTGTWHVAVFVLASVLLGLVGYHQSQLPESTNHLLLASLVTAVAMTFAEVKRRSQFDYDSLPKKDARSEGTIEEKKFPSLTLPFHALRRTQFGMLLMANPMIGMGLIVLSVVVAEPIARNSMERSFPVWATMLVATGLPMFLGGRSGEFFAVFPMSRPRRFGLVGGMGLLCIITPGLAAGLSVVSVDGAREKLQYVSHHSEGCDNTAAVCEQRFADAIEARSGLFRFSFDVDLVPSTYKGEPAYIPGPKAAVAFQRATLRDSTLLTMLLMLTYAAVSLIGFYSHHGGQTRFDRWSNGAYAFLGAGFVYALFSGVSLPYQLLGPVAGAAAATAFIVYRLRRIRFSLP